MDNYFQSRLGLSLRQVMKTDGYLITDETQLIFNTLSFWSYLKAGVRVRNLLSFSVFGLPRGAGIFRSPTQFQGKWYYEQIKFSIDESAELVKSFCAKVPNASHILVPEILGNIFEFVNYHPGLVYLALYSLCYEFPRTPYFAKTVPDFQTIIVKGRLLVQLLQARCFALKSSDIVQMLGDRTDNIMGQLISNGSINMDAFEEDTICSLNQCGMCIVDSYQRSLCFSSEIMKVFYRKLYYQKLYGIPSSFVVPDWKEETILKVLRRILELFNPRSLSKSLSVGRNDRKYERIYQDEFYRSCFLIAPSKCHPDVGAIYGSRGYLDFYIDSDVQYGFELLRNGDKINEHVNRFDPIYGIYKDIPLRDYAVVDFYESGKFQGTHMHGEKYYAVLFSEDFTSIQLLHRNVAIMDFQCGRN